MSPPPTLARGSMHFGIGVRLVGATALVVSLVLGVIVSLWITSERQLIRRMKRDEARSFAASMAGAWGNELADQNWNQIRLQLRQVMGNDEDYVYVFVTDAAQGDRIVAAEPIELVGRYVPDVVPLSVSRAAALTGQPRTAETFLLRDVEFPEGTVRAHRGERVVEVAADLVYQERRTGTLRVGISLRRVDAATRAIVSEAMIWGALCLGLGILGALMIARWLTAPVRLLEESATRMAAGDLAHRALIRRSDEIGALADAFNRMAGDLDRSFARLRGTLTSFERFVPQKFLHVVAPEGIDKIQVGTRSERTMSILFTDIRGYTSISEQSTAEEMFLFLNDYLGEMGGAIEMGGGFIDKFIGDAIMALFDEEHTEGAIDAALEMRRRLHAYNVKRVREGKLPIDIGIGIHRGPCIMGTVGFTSRMESTVIGDTVNLASRVEGLTKGYGVGILVTDAVVQALPDPKKYPLRVVDEAGKVKGKDEPVKLWGIDDRLSLV